MTIIAIARWPCYKNRPSLSLFLHILFFSSGLLRRHHNLAIPTLICNRSQSRRTQQQWRRHHDCNKNKKPPPSRHLALYCPELATNPKTCRQTPRSSKPIAQVCPNYVKLGNLGEQFKRLQILYILRACILRRPTPYPHEPAGTSPTSSLLTPIQHMPRIIGKQAGKASTQTDEEIHLEMITRSLWMNYRISPTTFS